MGYSCRRDSAYRRLERFCKNRSGTAPLAQPARTTASWPDGTSGASTAARGICAAGSCPGAISGQRRRWPRDSPSAILERCPGSPQRTPGTKGGNGEKRPVRWRSERRARQRRLPLTWASVRAVERRPPRSPCAAPRPPAPCRAPRQRFTRQADPASKAASAVRTVHSAPHVASQPSLKRGRHARSGPPASVGRSPAVARRVRNA